MEYIKLYDFEENEHIPIEEAKMDIIFYQQPWTIPSEHGVWRALKHSLTCYFPYCFYSLKTYFNYFFDFHGKMWKYFVETPYHKSDYKKEFDADNCVALGSLKLDNYKYVKEEDAQKHWKTEGKKRIIYAPHHSFDTIEGPHVATFDKNGDFILELAKKHPETEWIFRPHSTFVDRLISNNIRTITEIEKYYQEWEKIGTISKPDDNYYEQFVTSDCLITDCISFLAEYLPSNKPVLHLRNDAQQEPFNDVVEHVVESYYQIHNNEELEKTFEEVILNNNDYMKEKRLESKKYLMVDDNITTGQKIREYLEKELWLK